MSKKDNIIRVGDIVKIVKPYFFKRCGYPMSFEDACNSVKTIYKDKISSFILDVGLIDKPNKDISILEDKNSKEFSRIFNKIVSALAYDYIRINKFGGKEKTIHTIHSPDYKDCLMEVEKIKFVRTGIYTPERWSGGDGYSEDGCTPAYLDKEKTHKILYMSPLSAVFFYIIDNLYENFNIEAVNVEKIIKGN